MSHIGTSSDDGGTSAPVALSRSSSSNETAGKVNGNHGSTMAASSSTSLLATRNGSNGDKPSKSLVLVKMRSDQLSDVSLERLRRAHRADSQSLTNGIADELLDASPSYLFKWIILTQMVVYVEAGAIPALLNLLRVEFNVTFLLTILPEINLWYPSSSLLDGCLR
jgi:hypothetical protein